MSMLNNQITLTSHVYQLQVQRQLQEQRQDFAWLVKKHVVRPVHAFVFDRREHWYRREYIWLAMNQLSQVFTRNHRPTSLTVYYVSPDTYQPVGPAQTIMTVDLSDDELDAFLLCELAAAVTDLDNLWDNLFHEAGVSVQQFDTSRRILNTIRRDYNIAAVYQEYRIAEYAAPQRDDHDPARCFGDIGLNLRFARIMPRPFHEDRAQFAQLFGRWERLTEAMPDMKPTNIFRKISVKAWVSVFAVLEAITILYDVLKPPSLGSDSCDCSASSESVLK